MFTLLLFYSSHIHLIYLFSPSRLKPFRNAHLFKKASGVIWHHLVVTLQIATNCNFLPSAKRGENYGGRCENTNGGI